MSDKTFNERVALVQQALKAPKGQYNNFGKYSYRSCEDILEAVKPHLAEFGLFITITDEVQELCGRFYVMATATIRDMNSDKEIRVQAYAREPQEKKGMDESQITGSCSSYARKYALNGLLLIDDNKDADTMDNRDQGKDPAYDKRKALTEAQSRCKRALKKVAERDGFDPALTWEDIKKRDDFENTPGFWTARAVEYEMS